MNELQKMDQGTNVVTFNFFDPTQFETMQRVCKMFANSELVPDMYKVSDKNPIDKATANCMIAISIAMLYWGRSAYDHAEHDANLRPPGLVLKILDRNRKHMRTIQSTSVQIH